MSKPGDDRSLPKSMRHRKILDVAEDQPDAAIEAIAAKVPSATPDLVERVLDEHGDPAEDDTDSSTQSDADGQSSGADEPSHDGGGPDDAVSGEQAGTGDDAGLNESGPVTEAVTATTADDAASAAEDEGVPTPESMSSRQVETLQIIAEHPEATQRELAERLDVTAATVSNRVNDIPGFEWADRRQFVEAVLDVSTTSTADSTAMNTEVTELQQSIESLDERIAELETRLDGAENDRTPPFEDAELTHKVVHACMEATTISEDEELRILKTLLD